jgi:dipeptidyl aminopeptidase/acylaminoacyl peptidase
MKRCFYFVATVFMSCMLHAQNVMTPNDLLDFQRIGNEQVSPDGKFLVFLVTRVDVAENKSVRRVERVDLQTREQKTLVSEDINPSQISIHPDGKTLGFLSSQSGSSQYWEVALAGGPPLRYTDEKDGISLFMYSPDGKRLLIGKRIKMDKSPSEAYAGVPETKARLIDGLMYRHWNAWDDYSYNHLFLLKYRSDDVAGEANDILKDERFHAPTMPFGGTEEICFSPDSKKILYTCKKESGTAAALSTNTDIYSYDISSGKTENLSAGHPGYDKQPSYSPDGNKIAWLSMATAGYESDKNRILVKDIKKGTEEDITANFEYSAEAYCWNRSGSKIFFISTVNGTRQIFEYHVKDRKIRQVTRGVNDYTSVHAVGEGNKEYLVAGRMSMSYPLSLYKIDMNGMDDPLEYINAAKLSRLKMGNVERRMIKASDGKEILTWVIYPPGFDPAKKYPALLYCQGGPQSPVSQFFSYRWNFQLMAASGYIVIAPNRRGLPGFGKEWNDAIQGDYGGQAMQDLLSATDEMAREPFVDESRLGAVGASFGGYSVYWLAGNHNKRFKAFISHCGMFNMESWYGSTEEMFFANSDNGPYWEEKNKENYKKHSPHRYVDKWDTPILIIHNELDYRVPVSEGMQAFTAAQSRNIPSRFLYFPDEGHWVSKPQNSLLWQKVFFEFLDEWLKKP